MKRAKEGIVHHFLCYATKNNNATFCKQSVILKGGEHESARIFTCKV